MATQARLRDLPYLPFSDKPTTNIKTGTWKYVEPVYENALPPCAHACPAGNDISFFLLTLAKGDVLGAARWLRQRNPIPATLGRVCPHPCEGPCNRAWLGGAIAVHMVERFLGDVAGDVIPAPAPETGKKVAIVGAGPAGLAAAYNLRLAGHHVEVFDDKPAPGGYLRTGIPEYRLPRAVLDREVDLIAQLGVVFRQKVRVGREVSFEELRDSFDAVIVAVGFHRSRALGIPGEDHPQVYNGVKLLEQLLAGERPELPQRMAVVGGGNTAMDVARSLLRVGVAPVVVYRRTRAEMPAIAAEVEDAMAEGIPFEFLAAPVRVVVEQGRIVGLACQRMTLGEPDASGRRRPVPVPGSEFVLPCGGVVTALGEVTDWEGLPGELAADSRQVTAIPGVFLAGDVADGAGTVTAAVGSGIRVAQVVDSYLRSSELPAQAPRVQALWPRRVNVDRVVEFSRLNLAYLRSLPRPPILHRPVEERIGSFVEVVEGWSEQQAIAEARRCIECGTCNECSNCLYFCPDVAIHRADGGFVVDREHCKGCGICVEECPRDALTLREVVR